MKTGRERRYLSKFIESWLGFVQSHALAVVLACLLATAAILAFSIRNFRINTDFGAMISPKLRFRQLQTDFDRAFPNLTNIIVIILKSDNADTAMSARDRLTARLNGEPKYFRNVYAPGGGTFFQKNGLLYLSPDELQDFGDNMAAAQPFLALLSEDLSLRGLFSVFQKMTEHPEEAMAGKQTQAIFDRMSATFEGVLQKRNRPFPWQEIMLGEKQSVQQRTQFIMLQPANPRGGLSGEKKTLTVIRSIARELGITESNGVKMFVTGDVPLNEETLVEVRSSVGIATVASLLLVSIILYIGLGRSGRLISSAIITLFVGLVWTTGFAIAAIGSLNMISVTFAVLFIGLAIDYSIQVCLRTVEFARFGIPQGESAFVAARKMARPLLLSCITTAIGFYSFIPTAYAGVAELGLISGTGMFISFFLNMTLLPALLAAHSYRPAKAITPRRLRRSVASLPYKYPVRICIAFLILGIASVPLLPRIYFDYNPLDLYNPKSESVVAIRELFKDPETAPWTISVLEKGEKETNETAEKLRALKEVKMAITLFDFVPEKQPEKMSLIENIALFMPSELDHVTMRRLSYEENMTALTNFEAALGKTLAASDGHTDPSVQRLHTAIQKFRNSLGPNPEGQGAFDLLERNLLGPLPDLFHRLAASLNPGQVTMADLPEQLKAQYKAVDGRYRVQVFPRANLMDRNSLASFVNAVQAVTPHATDAPVTIYESGMAVISSFRHAVMYAIVAITIVLLLDRRSLYFTALILTPLVLAMVLTGAVSFLLGIPLNFANVIVVPLLLGTGVHNGIIFFLRYKNSPPHDGNMLRTSTARAILFSSLTTMISTGSLSFSAHRGISSMGILLTICFGFLIFSVLMLFPALLSLAYGSGPRHKKSISPESNT